ncbi:MFS transporter [Amycolatopsis sp. CA-230715]|uniref:MFS transporter n=1 Tax=Amycolatopsis sp. CA-230715 TaxID=2745196 RepID=UPI001C0193B1|nr:MFS transporter [Amycolatopsis sp. CA-230715]QWF85964.1 hypothetical protein HUW46_09445 [Amycolatopsis sp. CA-230715]
MTERTAPRPLYRNRNYNILWTGLLVSELGYEIALIGFPLLIMAQSGSALQMGLVSTVVAVAHMAGNVPAGVIADRWHRGKVLVTCQCVRAVAMTCLGATLVFGGYSFAVVLAVAVVDGLCGAVFEPTEQATLPHLVAAEQLPRAVARNTARPYLATLFGPAIAGFLFTVHHTVPFLADAAMLAISCTALLFLRLPRRRAERDPAAGPRRAHRDLLDGFRWLLGQRVLRTTLVWLMCSQIVFSGLVIIILVRSGEDDIAPGGIGVMMACFGAGGVLGAAAAAKLHAALPSVVIIIGFSWVAAALTLVMAFVPSGVPLGLVFGALVFFLPVMITTVTTYQLVVTPDGLRGRVSGVVGFCAGAASAVGPLAGALVVGAAGDGSSGVLLCAGALACVAIGASLSPSLLRFPTVRPVEPD